MPEVNKASPVRGALGKKYYKANAAALVDETKLYKALYSRVFDSRDGKKVLEDLRKRFYDNEISESDINREVGRRDVLHFINRRVTPE